VSFLSPELPPNPSDAELLAAHVAGDHEAFSTLVRRHQDRLWAVAVRTIGDREDAADALQDALVNAFRRAESYKGDAAVTTWLHRIVVNACLDRIRRRRPTEPLSDPVSGVVDSGRTVGSARASPSAGGADPADVVTTRVDITAALATLPAEQRVALVLVDMQGYPIAEAAEILQCPVGTVKSRCARGRAALLPLLAPGREPAGGTP
jgi:RNA polymerase sigma-70 factor, ECF subfamily